MTAENQFRITAKGWYTLGRVLLFCLGCVVILAGCSGITKNLPVGYRDQVSILAAAILTFLWMMLFVKWEKGKLGEVGVIPGKYSIARFLSGYLIGFCMAVSQALIVLVYGHFQLKLVPQMSWTNIFSPLLLYFLIACREELAFRAYPLRRLNSSLGPVWALTIIAIIFIVEHVGGGMTWTTAVLGSGAGAVLFGVAALKTKGLALPLGLHSAWNFGQWMVGFKNKPGIWEAVVEKGHETEMEKVGLAAFLLVMGIAITGICWYYRKNKLSENPSPPAPPRQTMTQPPHLPDIHK